MCAGGVSSDLFGESVCKAGNEGPYCSVCSDEYKMQAGKCVLCSEQESSPWAPVLVFVVCVIGAVALYYLAPKVAKCFRNDRRKGGYAGCFARMDKTGASCENVRRVLLRLAGLKKQRRASSISGVAATQNQHRRSSTNENRRDKKICK